MYLLDLEALQEQFCSFLHLESLNLPCLSKKIIIMIKKETKTESYIVKRGKFASHNRTSKNKSFRSTMHRAGKVRLRASTFYRLTSQKNPKSKDVFDITGRVLCETAVTCGGMAGTGLNFEDFWACRDDKYTIHRIRTSWQ